MIQRTAYRAGRAPCQRSGHHARLLVKKRLVLSVICLPQAQRFFLCFDIFLLFLREDCLLLLQLFYIGIQPAQRRPLLLQRGFLRSDSLPFLSGAFQPLPLLLKPRRFLLKRSAALFRRFHRLQGCGSLLLFSCALRRLFAKLVIGRQQEFNLCDLSAQLLLLHDRLLCAHKCRQRIFLPYGGVLLCPLILHQRGFRRLIGRRPGKLRNHALQPLLRLRQLPVQLVLRALVRLNQRRKQLHDLRHRQFAPPCPFGVVCAGRIFAAGDSIRILADACRRLPQLALYLRRPALELILKDDIQARSKDIAKDLLPLPRVRLQKLSEIALGNHRHLSKLLARQADDARNGPVHFPQLADHAPIRIRQLCVGKLPGHARASRLCTLIFWIAPDSVFLTIVRKGELHKRRRFRPGIFGAEHAHLAVIPAGRAKERIGDRIENRRLSCARIACDQIQSALPQPAEIQLLYARIRAKARDGQFDRPHACPSQMDSISCCAKSLCSSLIGWLFCSSYSSLNSSSGDLRCTWSAPSIT